MQEERMVPEGQYHAVFLLLPADVCKCCGLPKYQAHPNADDLRTSTPTGDDEFPSEEDIAAIVRGSYWDVKRALAAFAKKIAAEEREACAKVADQNSPAGAAIRRRGK